MKLHGFINNSVDYLHSEEFNENFWLTYLALGILGVCCMAFFFIPPVFFLGIFLVLTPLVIYGALWTGIGLLKLIDLVINPSSVEYIPLNENSVGNEIDDFYALSDEFEHDSMFSQSYENPRRFLVDGYKSQFVGVNQPNALNSEALVLDQNLISAAKA